MRSRGQTITELNTIRPAAALLPDDYFDILFAGEKKRPDGWRDSGRDLCDAVFSNHARSAWHG
jgi:hypothetical protein